MFIGVSVRLTCCGESLDRRADHVAARPLKSFLPPAHADVTSPRILSREWGGSAAWRHTIDRADGTLTPTKNRRARRVARARPIVPVRYCPPVHHGQNSKAVGTNRVRSLHVHANETRRVQSYYTYESILAGIIKKLSVSNGRFGFSIIIIIINSVTLTSILMVTRVRRVRPVCPTTMIRHVWYS